MELFGLILETSVPFGRDESEAWKVVLGILAVGLGIGWRWLPRRLGLGLLGTLAVVSTLNYARFDPELVTEKYDTYDLMHYYLNAKYFDELGYYDLYPACMLADLENDGPYFKKQGAIYMAQNEAGHGRRPISHGIERGQKVRATRFTPERWTAFEHDFLVLQRTGPSMNDKLWRQMIIDHGYNGTPTWTLLARPLAEWVPVEHVKLLGYIDLVLLLGATLVVAWAYSTETGLWVWLALMLGYSLRWPTVSWAFLRYDYVALLMVAMAAIKKGRYGLAGALTGISATFRLFPALWMVGPAAKGLFNLPRRVVHRQLLVLAAGFLAAAAVAEGGTALRLGTDTIVAHFDNMMDHNSAEQLSSRRIGLALALPYRGELEPKLIEPERKQIIDAQKPLRFAISAVLLAALGWGLRRAEDDETFAFGFVPFFLLTTASYYYYVTRITLVMLHAQDLRKPRNIVGLTLLFGLEIFSHWAESVLPGYRVYLIGRLAWGLLVYVFVMTVFFNIEARQQEKADAKTAVPEP